ncbi:MAG: hypothetical protein KIT87_04070 [Anaerolineae bacterium]|nr:hypothetical protein [Anaerolineae bacterium]
MTLIHLILVLLSAGAAGLGIVVSLLVFTNEMRQPALVSEPDLFSRAMITGCFVASLALSLIAIAT